jgi:hypothetical protein
MLSDATKRGTVLMQALGIIAFELLTEMRVFAPFSISREDMVDTLRGNQALPWEDQQSAQVLLPRLRVLKRSILACLERDPSKRPKSTEVLGKWISLLETETAKASRASAGQRSADMHLHAAAAQHAVVNRDGVAVPVPVVAD